jgi:hypothetical protein
MRRQGKGLIAEFIRDGFVNPPRPARPRGKEVDHEAVKVETYQAPLEA